jgi:hypothetical protein
LWDGLSATSALALPGIARRGQKEELVSVTTSRDAELLIADVEDISWEDLMQEMLPENNIIPITCCSGINTCDPGNCDIEH